MLECRFNKTTHHPKLCTSSAMAEDEQRRRDEQLILHIFGPENADEAPRHVCMGFLSDWDVPHAHLYGPDTGESAGVSGSPARAGPAHKTPDGQEPTLMAELVAAALKQAAAIGR